MSKLVERNLIPIFKVLKRMTGLPLEEGRKSRRSGTRNLVVGITKYWVVKKGRTIDPVALEY